MKKLLAKKTLLTTKLFTVTDETLIDPHDATIHRLIVEASGAAVVLPLDGEGRILLVRQYRHPALESLWELPAGKIDAGETPLQCAKRELIEETGLRAKQWKKLIAYYPSAGFLRETMTIFLAQKLVEGDAALDHGEENLVSQWFTPHAIEAMIRSGKIKDGKTIVGMYAWLHLSGGAAL